MENNNNSNGFYVNKSTVYVKKAHVPFPMGSVKLRNVINEAKTKVADELTEWIQLGLENERAMENDETD